VKIRVSMVRFRPRPPPLQKMPGNRKVSGHFQLCPEDAFELPASCQPSSSQCCPDASKRRHGKILGSSKTWGAMNTQRACGAPAFAAYTGVARR
jgi:hypothetical protein